MWECYLPLIQTTRAPRRWGSILYQQNVMNQDRTMAPNVEMLEPSTPPSSTQSNWDLILLEDLT